MCQNLFKSLIRGKQGGMSSSKKNLRDRGCIVTERKIPGIRCKTVSVLQGKKP